MPKSSIKMDNHQNILTENYFCINPESVLLFLTASRLWHISPVPKLYRDMDTLCHLPVIVVVADIKSGDALGTTAYVNVTAISATTVTATNT